MFKYKHKWSIWLICKVLGVSKSGYYRWQDNQTYTSERYKQKLLIHIREVFDQSRNNYGYRRIYKELKRRGIRCYRNQVAKLMRENNLRPKIRKKFRYTGRSVETKNIPPNLLNRDFRIRAINKAWVSDITYIWTSEGWLYLSAIIDLGSRNIISWQISEKMEEKIVVDTVKDALRLRKPQRGLIFHSDRGGQYFSKELVEILEENEHRQSMSNKGDCWDNAVAESFFSTLKKELVYKTKFKTKEEARLKIFDYIEMFYKTIRLHSTIGDIPPAEYEKQFLA